MPFAGGLSETQRLTKGKRKLEAVTKGVTDRLSSSLNVDMGSPSTDPDANMERSDDLQAYMRA